MLHLSRGIAANETYSHRWHSEVWIRMSARGLRMTNTCPESWRDVLVHGEGRICLTNGPQGSFGSHICGFVLIPGAVVCPELMIQQWTGDGSWCAFLQGKAADPGSFGWELLLEAFYFYAECVRDLKCCLIKLLFVGCIDYTQPALVSLPFPHYFWDQRGSRWLSSRGANVIFLVRRLVLLRQPFIISASFIDHNNSCKAQGAFQTVSMPLFE